MRWTSQARSEGWRAPVRENRVGSSAGPEARRDCLGQLKGWIMQPCVTETQQTLTALLQALEDEAAKSTPQDGDQRSESRRPMYAECELWLLRPAGDPIAIRDAVTRNLTFLGLSVVAKLPQLVRPGRPVEAVIKVPDFTNTHVAGTVAFCRPVEDDCHEVGINVKAAGSAPILIHRVAASAETYDWFAEALTVPE